MPPDPDAEFDATLDSLDRYERTIDAQLDLITAIDEKAANVVRYTTLLVGAIFTALSVVSRSSVLSLHEIRVLPRLTFYVGVVALVVAISVAIVTYVSSVREYGPDPSYGYAVAEGLVETPQYEDVLLTGYADAVRDNGTVIDTNARRFRWALIALLVGIVYSVLSGVLVTLEQTISVKVSLIAVTTMGVASVAYRIYEEGFLVLQRGYTNHE